MDRNESNGWNCSGTAGDGDESGSSGKACGEERGKEEKLSFCSLARFIGQTTTTEQGCRGQSQSLNHNLGPETGGTKARAKLMLKMSVDV